MGDKVVHFISGDPTTRVELDSEDIELAIMELQSLNLQGPTDMRWIKVVLEFRDSGASFAEAASIVYLARKQLRSTLAKVGEAT